MTQKGLRTRILIILYIISFVISLFIFSALMSRVHIDIECSSYADYCVSGSDIYFAQNIREGGIILKVNSSGNASKMYRAGSMTDSRVSAICVNDGFVYAILSGFREKENSPNPNNPEIETTYRVIAMDNKLGLLTQSPRFTLQEGIIVKGLSVDRNGIYITAVAENGAYVKVYSIDKEVLRDPKEDSAVNINVDIIRTKNPVAGRFYSDALYTEGQLYVRTDADEPTGVFEIDPYVKGIVSNIRLSFGHLFALYSRYITSYIAALLIWFIVLFLVYRAVLDRNRSFYYIIIAEAVLFVIVLVGVIAVSDNYIKARRIEHSRFAITSMLGIADEAGLNETIDYADLTIYDSVRYQQIKDILCEFVHRDGNSAIFYDVFVYRLKDNIVCVSGSGQNRQLMTEVYGQELESITDDLYKGETYAAVDLVIDGQDYRAVALEVDRTTPDYAIVGIINATNLDASVFVNNAQVFVVFLLAFAVGSIFVVLAWFLHLRDITLLENALSEAAAGNKMPERPAVLGRDIKDMWDSTAEICKKVEEVEYNKLRILEAYYRFAPKNVEKALLKKSILEVASGDRAQISGTLAVVSIDISGGRRLKKLESVVNSIGEYQKDHNCMIVGRTPDMSQIDVLFLDSVTTTINYITELYNQNLKGEDRVTMSTALLFDDCKFGVLGSEEEATTFMYTSKQALLRKINAFAMNLRLGLVVTEDVLKRENYGGPTRFVGYILSEQGEEIALHEVLDAYPANIRKQRLATVSKYKEALDAYYEKDFYIARTKFSEILKEAPLDSLVRWYVFESDKYLNEFVEGDSYKYVHT